MTCYIQTALVEQGVPKEEANNFFKKPLPKENTNHNDKYPNLFQGNSISRIILWLLPSDLKGCVFIWNVLQIGIRCWKHQYAVSFQTSNQESSTGASTTAAVKHSTGPPSSGRILSLWHAYFLHHLRLEAKGYAYIKNTVAGKEVDLQGQRAGDEGLTSSGNTFWGSFSA